MENPRLLNVHYTLSMHYETVVGLIESEGLKKYYVFGHSYGGWIAAQCAMEKNLQGIILEESAGLREFMEDRAKKPGITARTWCAVRPCRSTRMRLCLERWSMADR